MDLAEFGGGGKSSDLSDPPLPTGLIMTHRKSTPGFSFNELQMVYVYITPKSPKGGSKTIFVLSLCENFQRQSCSITIPLSNGP